VLRIAATKELHNYNTFLRDPPRGVLAHQLLVHSGIVPVQPEAQYSADNEESRVKCVAQLVERLVLRPVDPNADDLAWASEGDVEARCQGARGSIADVVRDPGAESRQASKHAGRGDAEEAIADCKLFSRKRGWRSLVSNKQLDEGHADTEHDSPWMMKAMAPTEKQVPAIRPRIFFLSERMPAPRVTTYATA
jgi:hypothetical protein